MIQNIGIVGLGLIGGSMAKAIKKRSSCRVYGYDLKESTMEQALASSAIDGPLEDLSQLDLLIVALFPQAAVQYIEQHVQELKAGALVCDLCGVKESVVSRCTPLCRRQGVEFIGCHPMAGREKWGFEACDADLFQRSSMILTPEGADEQKVEQLRQFWLDLGFGRCVVTTAENHDRMIGYTSQMAHVLSNAYIKNPLCLEFSGYTGGSFQDLTRVAKLNPLMWTELFFCNRENLLHDCDVLIAHLQEYRQALADGDEETMCRLLKEGSDLKETLLEQKQSAEQ